MNDNQISGSIRQSVGTGSARAMRANGLIPAVLYGDNKPPLAIALPSKEITKRIHKGGFMTNILEIEVKGEKYQALPKDFQRHPVKENILHIDLLRISKSTVVTVEVPVNFINEDTCPGIKMGGVLNIVRHRVEVSCPATNIPESFVIDLGESQLGDSLNISAVTLPDEVKPTITDRDFTIATIATPAALRAEDEEKPAEGEEGEVKEGEEKAEGDTKAESENKDSEKSDKGKE